MILGFIGVFVFVGLVAVLVSTDSSQAEVAIVSPNDGVRVEAGKVPVRIRVQGLEVAKWELSLKGPHTRGEWMLLARGGSEPVYSALGSGLHFIDLNQPGTYELSLKVTDRAGNLIEALSDFSVGE